MNRRTYLRFRALARYLSKPAVPSGDPAPAPAPGSSLWSPRVPLTGEAREAAMARFREALQGHPRDE